MNTEAISDQRSAISARWAVFVVVALALFIVGVFLWQMQLPVKTIVLESPDGQKRSLQVEVASTPAQQERGLMFRRGITRGMLFVFPEPRPLSFWMKNTLMPLDVLYFAADGSFLNAVSMTPCRADPCISYPSRGTAKYALEEPAGFVRREGVGSGWRLQVVDER